MLTRNHLFHAVFVGNSNLYFEVEVKDNMAIRHPSQVGINLSTNAFRLTDEVNPRFEAVAARLTRNEKLVVNTAGNRRMIIGLADGLVKSVEQDYGFRFLRGAHAGYLRQSVFALEYMQEAFDKLPRGESSVEMYQALNNWYSYQLGRKAT